MSTPTGTPGLSPPRGRRRPPPVRPGSEVAGSKLARRLLDRPLRDLGLGGAVLVLAVTAGFGGLEPVEPEPTLRFEAEQTVVAAPFEVTVRDIRWATDLPGPWLSEEGNRWIAVVATVVNTDRTAQRGAGPLAWTLSLEDVDGLVRSPDPMTGAVRSDTSLVLVDGSTLDPVQPDMPYQAAFLFEQDGDVPPPDTATVALVAHTWRAGNLDDTESWFDPTVVGRAVLPVAEAPAEEDDA